MTVYWQCKECGAKGEGNDNGERHCKENIDHRVLFDESLKNLKKRILLTKSQPRTEEE